MNRRLGALFRTDPAEVQGAFYLLKGLVLLVDLKRVDQRMGHIREPWLMRTVGGLLCALGATLLAAHRRGRVTPELRRLGAWSAFCLLAADLRLYTSRRGRRAPALYLGDAAAQAALFVAQCSAHARQPLTVDVRHGPQDPARYGAGEHGRWNILPGETRDANGKRDIVAEGSMSSFPASDPPSYMG